MIGCLLLMASIPSVKPRTISFRQHLLSRLASFWPVRSLQLLPDPNRGPDNTQHVREVSMSHSGADGEPESIMARPAALTASSPRPFSLYNHDVVTVSSPRPYSLYNPDVVTAPSPRPYSFYNPDVVTAPSSRPYSVYNPDVVTARSAWARRVGAFRPDHLARLIQSGHHRYVQQSDPWLLPLLSNRDHQLAIRRSL